MLKPSNLFEYQRKAVLHQLYHDKSMLWLGCGLGKTPTTLTTIDHRMRAGQVQKTLVFGPLRVIHAVWEREARKWEHTKHLRFSVIHGNEKKRLRQLFASADIYLCNYENMGWLSNVLDHYYISQGKPLPFQMVVYDEITRVKNSNSQRVAGGNITRQKLFVRKPSEPSEQDLKGKGLKGKALREEKELITSRNIQRYQEIRQQFHRNKDDMVNQTGELVVVPEIKERIIGWREMVQHFKYSTGLTGTPSSNGYIDLHGQYLVIDNGERLGQYISHYRDSYFAQGYDGWTYDLTEMGKKWIEHKIADITIKMDSEDYLTLPPLKINDIMVDLPAKVMQQYREVEKDMFTRLDNGTEIELFNRASVSNKCLQFCIAEGTEVLTKSGWKNIENIKAEDEVWDGCEWSSVDGLVCNGYKEVIDCDGVDMTPDHKVLTISGWVESQEAVYGNASGRFNRKSVRLPGCVEQVRDNKYKKQKSYMVSALHLWKRIYSYRSKLEKSKQTGDKVMRLSPRGNNLECDRWSRYDRSQSVGFVVQHDISLSQSKRQRLCELWCSWNNSLSKMGKLFFRLLGRHGFNLQRSPDDRKSGQQRELLQRELQMGNENASSKQQEDMSLHQHTDGKNNCDTSSKTLQPEPCDDFCENKIRVVGERSYPAKRIKKVYDLVNVGDKHRFTVRGSSGEVFMVHNCNGSPYNEPMKPEWTALHDEKLQTLDSIVEEAQGKTILLGYSFKSDAERIMKRYKHLKPVNLTKVPAKDLSKVIDQGNKGQIKLMLGHPASLGHGVDGLNDFCHIIVWFGLNWSLELYEQLIGRIASGQRFKQPVTMHRILCNDTIDLAVADALRRKDSDQVGLKKAIQRYRDGMLDGSIDFM